MWSKLFPYWFLIFTIGFGWFVMAPLVPSLESLFHVALASVIFIISAYGYTMVVFGLLAGFMSARFTVRNTLVISSLLSFLGLTGRALFTNIPTFSLFLIFSLVAAVAYPLAVAPIGSVAEITKERSQSVVGISVGLLFLGMSLGSFTGPAISSSLGISGTLWLAASLSVIALVWILLGTRGYPRSFKRSLKGSFKFGMIKNWYVGLAISSISVMFGSIASTVLLVHSVPLTEALSFGGLLGGVAFLGSAIGAIIITPFFEHKKKLGLIVSGILTLASASMMVLSISFTTNLTLISLGYFLFGFFGNAYWSMALNSTVSYVSEPAMAGLATSLFSVVSNLGVAFIPVFLGGLFSDISTIPEGAVIVIGIEVVAGVLSFFLKVE